MRIILLFIVIALAVSCQTYSDNEINHFDQEITEYIANKDLQFDKLESGLYYNVISDSSSGEEIKYTDQVTFYYSGEFLSGEVFQEIPENESLTFKVKELIAGWQEGLMMLHGPGSIELIIPPHLGYGSKNTEKIPPNSILRYELTVTNVK